MTPQSSEKFLKKEGILLLDKPQGKTSFYLIKVLRSITNIQKIGHAGTLDPFATGVMVLLIGKSFTRLSDSYLSHDKAYRATLELGFITDTFDIDGQKIKVSDKKPSLDEIKQVLSLYQGDVLQIPPMFSAKKINGKKLYELARAGQSIERKPVKVNMQIKIALYEYPFLTLEITCSKGTYIRSLANDIGKDLSTGAYLTHLSRTRSGPFTLEQCVDFSWLKDENFDYKRYLIGNECKS